MGQIIIFNESKTLKTYFSAIALRFKKHNPQFTDASSLPILSDQQDFFLLIADYQLAEREATLIEQMVAKRGVTVIFAANLQKKDLLTAKLEKLTLEGQWLKGIIDTSRAVHFAYPAIRSCLELNQINQGLKKAFEQTSQAMKKARNLHQKLTPIRRQTIKHISLAYKCAMGRSAGGDFFDTIASKSHLLILLATSSSYIVSPTLFSAFEKNEKQTLFEQKSFAGFFKGNAAKSWP